MPHSRRRHTSPITHHLPRCTDRRTAPLLTLPRGTTEALPPLRTPTTPIRANLSTRTALPAPPTITAVRGAVAATFAAEGELLWASPEDRAGLRGAGTALEAGSAV
jgi:hypothetical protein